MHLWHRPVQKKELLMKRSGFPSDSHDESISIESMLLKRVQVTEAACGHPYTLKTAAFERC